MPRLKVAIVSCYKNPDYARTKTLRVGMESISEFNTKTLVNVHKSWLRYPEILIGIYKLHKNFRPDAYLLTFRGQELLPFLILFSGGKPIIFDEFIVPLAWANENESPSLRSKFMRSVARYSTFFYRQWLASCKFIIADTQEHAEASARLSGVNSRSYRVIFMDEEESSSSVAAVSRELKSMLSELVS